MSFDITWFLGTVSVATYLAAILRTIPRMRFYRQKSHHKRTPRLPNIRVMASVYATFVTALGTMVIVCSFFIGYLRDRARPDPYSSIHSKSLSILMAIQYTIQSISCFLIAIAFLIYGNKLIKIASEGLSLFEDFNGYPTTPTSNRFSYSTIGINNSEDFERRHCQLKRSIIKMHVLNLAFTASLAILGTFIGLFAFFHESIFENLTLSEASAALDNWIPMILNVFVMAGIAYGEIRIPDKSEPTLANLIYPTTPTTPRRHSSDEELPITITTTTSSSSTQTTDGRVSFHTRNLSTDSDSPLLSWPIPKAVVPTHIRSNELTYMSQYVNGNSSTSLLDDSAANTTASMAKMTNHTTSL
ncbi:13196_t:CDS:2 [Acaulospora colombiana]|uniref:13196_t:CDS:1 n=1 Tax=Acaulospora colombiana TaxID=27376 RepID=A0ACA9LBQ3_9GLOM|nr:13196_t:CDS:2 [Acaulospora colombiana]